MPARYQPLFSRGGEGGLEEVLVACMLSSKPRRRTKFLRNLFKLLPIAAFSAAKDRTKHISSILETGVTDPERVSAEITAILFDRTCDPISYWQWAWILAGDGFQPITNGMWIRKSIFPAMANPLLRDPHSKGQSFDRLTMLAHQLDDFVAR